MNFSVAVIGETARLDVGDCRDLQFWLDRRPKRFETSSESPRFLEGQPRIARER